PPRQLDVTGIVDGLEELGLAATEPHSLDAGSRPRSVDGRDATGNSIRTQWRSRHRLSGIRRRRDGPCPRLPLRLAPRPDVGEPGAFPFPASPWILRPGACLRSARSRALRSGGQAGDLG